MAKDTTKPAPKQTVEKWLEELKPELWKHAGARALHCWPVGAELSREDYEKALDAAAHVSIS